LVLAGGLHVVFETSAEVFLEHDVAAKSKEEAAQAGTRLAKGIAGAGLAGPERIQQGVRVIDAQTICGIEGTSKADGEINGALRVQRGQAKEQGCNEP